MFLCENYIGKDVIKGHHVLQGQYGDLFDCIDINKQPAFDNPLLANHKIQVCNHLLCSFLIS
ncbi:hypothetical protein QJS04_geneDACA002027 [Acorus gramineus]|uniref:Neprosin activation peptide domain-containing protein n=1 Tax=Acorus gramineus TaxID=55184 RepID=A0AAV9A9B3_ACOGR|nr:hypothetical protein QJS04_geneDACA002027 [Acorus gramineus]